MNPLKRIEAKQFPLADYLQNQGMQSIVRSLLIKLPGIHQSAAL